MKKTEFELIKTLSRIVGKPTKSIIVGIGDDAAIISASHKKAAITVDMMVENVHFDLSYIKPEELGHKCIAINLSDLAAVGAKPKYVLLSLGIRKGINESFLKRLYYGIKKICNKFKVEIIGGNISRSREFIIDVVAYGEIFKSPILRSGAKIGDKVAITGPTGFSALGRMCLKNSKTLQNKKLIKAHLTPSPKVNEGFVLANKALVNSMIDISDGLSSELHHISEASNVGIVINHIPMPNIIKSTAKILKIDPLLPILHGGEDYELLFTFNPKHENQIINVLTRMGSKPVIIGHVISKKIVKIETKELSKNIEKRGWDHLYS